MDGTDLINDAGGDVVAVLIQYRLGAFGDYFLPPKRRLGVYLYVLGFLAGNEVKEKGALNAGLRTLNLAFHLAKLTSHIQVDQELALKWVQQHVSALGPMLSRKIGLQFL